MKILIAAVLTFISLNLHAVVSDRFPVAFVPEVDAGWNILEANNKNFGGLIGGAAFSAMYLRHYNAFSFEGSATYASVDNKELGSEYFYNLEGTVYYGFYTKRGSKLLAGWTPITRLKSTGNNYEYYGMGLKAKLYIMLKYPYQLILSAEQNRYDRLYKSSDEKVNLHGDQKLKVNTFLLGLGYEF